MLRITVPPGVEQYDEIHNLFLPPTKEQTLSLEHSLVSLSKWEAKWHKPFLSREPKTMEESIDYVRCMTLTQNVDPRVYMALTPQLLAKVSAYIDESMTATTLPKGDKPPSREIVTSEVIYYWMISYNIPFECQKWHLSRLITLINVCNAKTAPQKKLSRNELMARNRALNASRRKKLNTRG